MSMKEQEVEFKGGPLCGHKITMQLGENPMAEIDAERHGKKYLYVLIKDGDDKYCFMHRQRSE